MLLVWTERGGPPAAPPAAMGGYRTRLVDRTISGQLGGSIDYNWSQEGVIITMRMNKDALAS
jgi:two-component sensor histidine kinase